MRLIDRRSNYEENPMLKIVTALFVAASLTACATTTASSYVPQELPLKEGQLLKFPVNGVVEVGNAQPAISSVTVADGDGTSLGSNYKDITQLMVEQTKKEIAKNGTFSSSGQVKTINLKVTHLRSTYVAFYWTSDIKYTATLGTSATIEKTSNYGSGRLAQSLNGSIAEAVKDLLSDEAVLAYLAQ
jgi:hypothetical protein